MHKNQIWLAFLAAIALTVLGFTGKTLYELFRYRSLTETTLPTDLSWSSKQTSRGRHLLVGSYSYSVGGMAYKGMTEFDDTPYKSPEAVQAVMARDAERPHPVWYSAAHPEESSLQKIFPTKSLFYTAALWLILLYLIWLGFYVGSFSRKTHTFSRRKL